MTDSTIERSLRRWRLKPDGPVTETPLSWVLPVRHGHSPAMLKVLKPTSDEVNAAALLRYWDGAGAVRLYEADANALLMERADGSRSLTAMAISGHDTQAAEILAETATRLHTHRHHAISAQLTSLQERFSSLYAREAMVPLLTRCAAVAHHLLATERDIIPLHGDLHHGNVLDGGQRGWLAIDPKALIGERAYDVANVFQNPWLNTDIVHRPERMRWLAELFAARLHLDMQRVLAFALAHAGLCASWEMEDGGDPSCQLRNAELLNSLVHLF